MIKRTFGTHSAGCRELFVFIFTTDNPRYMDTHRDMNFVTLYRICQYIETEFHSIILPPEKKSNAKWSIYEVSIYRGLTVYVLYFSFKYKNNNKNINQDKDFFKFRQFRKLFGKIK